MRCFKQISELKEQKVAWKSVAVGLQPNDFFWTCVLELLNMCFITLPEVQFVFGHYKPVRYACSRSSHPSYYALFLLVVSGHEYKET
jgi:hypothetical protein